MAMRLNEYELKWAIDAIHAKMRKIEHNGNPATSKTYKKLQQMEQEIYEQTNRAENGLQR
jgi:predicted RNA polymerase sigma factor